MSRALGESNLFFTIFVSPPLIEAKENRYKNYPGNKKAGDEIIHQPAFCSSYKL